MSEMSWRDAIVQVLQKSVEPMHYTDIADAIAEDGLKTDVGATPAATVNAIFAVSIKKEGNDSPFRRVSRGFYTLAASYSPALQIQPLLDEQDETGLINAFGMYWARSGVNWTANPRILGQQQVGSAQVDFREQHGVYMLHDGRAVIYVGRTTDQCLGARLKQHTIDRLNGRWDRFSWFGVYSVAENGSLDSNGDTLYTLDMLIATMEALLIEGLEPPQNRKRGDDFRAVEFLQVEDPEIQKNQIARWLDSMKSKL